MTTSANKRMQKVIDLARQIAAKTSPGVEDVAMPKPGQPIPVEHFPVPGFADGGGVDRIRAAVEAYRKKTQQPVEALPHGSPERQANLARFLEGNHPSVPHVLYHGTVADNFGTVDPERSDLGFHMGTRGQAHSRLKTLADNGKEYADYSRMIPVHASIKNPIRLRDRGHFGANVGDQLHAMGLINGRELDEIMEAPSHEAMNAIMQKYIRRAGHDGVVYLNRYEVPGEENPTAHPLTTDEHFKRMYPTAEDSYIAFKPEQVKNAVGNNGNYDPKRQPMNESHGGFLDHGKAVRRAVMAAKSAKPTVYFEVAPGRTWDPQQQESWEQLHPSAKAAVSNKMIREFIEPWKKATGVEGQVRPGLGGFGGHTNPNYTFEPHDPSHIHTALTGLGELYRQDSMMGAAEHPFEGSFPSGVIRVHLPTHLSPDEIHEIYSHLNKHGLAEGHSTDLDRGTMDILHGSGGEDTAHAAQQVDKLLGGKYNVASYPTNIAFPEHGEHYGVSRTPPGGPPGPPAQGGPDHLQSQASRRLAALLQEAHRQGGGHQSPVDIEHFKLGGAAVAKRGGGSLFDMSALHEVPNVPQFDLPRYIPPRGPSKRVVDVTADKRVRQQMLDIIHKGREMGGERWYNAEPLRLEFVNRLGKENGNQAFLRYMDYVAASSPRSKVPENVRNASYYYHREMQGLGPPSVGDKNPQPYGHLAQRLHQMNANRVYGEGWDPLNNPKPASFAQNLAGNQMPATIDTHAFRLPAILAKDPRFLETAYESKKGAPKRNIRNEVKSGLISLDDAAKTAAFWSAVPNDNEYGHMENFYKSLAKEHGITPGQAQASAWVGGGHLTGLASDETKSFMDIFHDRIHHTAQETGMDPHDVLDKFIRGSAPLRASGGEVDAALSVARRASKKPPRT